MFKPVVKLFRLESTSLRFAVVKLTWALGKVEQATHDMKRDAKSCGKLSVLGFKCPLTEDSGDSGIYFIYNLHGY